ncbi:MAG: uracil-DNA glycosylase family protein [Thermoanaerobaculia bacterium]|nr:uracil-DNA glycosylase family protein [Thermoanaerobaculia bacterium]
MRNLLTRIRACTECATDLPHGPRPIVAASPECRIVIIGQAPGRKVHETGVPWNDPSGDRLRDWMDVDQETFYDDRLVAIVPMGFCYPGKGRSGDLPPRPECAPLWHAPVLRAMPKIRLTLLIGRFAQGHYLEGRQRASLTETVRSFDEYVGDGLLPLPHPSPRNNLWIRRNPWFRRLVVPALRRNVAVALT